jgi:hypothetical protein
MSSLGVVIFGSTSVKRRNIAALSKHLGVTDLHILNNDKASLQEDEISGNNLFYEFSGYYELCRHFTGEGPFVILNDTLWVNRLVGGWQTLLRSAIRQINGNGVWGDLRVEGGVIPERPNTYLASWIFVIPNREVLSQFAASLSVVMHDAYPPPSPAYKVYLDRWFVPRWYGGWHGVRSNESLARKLQCIRMEHTLSAVITEKGLRVHALGEKRSLFYALLRLIDRSYTFFKRLKAIQT